jgi:hypothetical protein
MNSYIKGIALFRDNTSKGKSVIELSRGLNIISGESKTGKSALIDVIDWCLGATECRIPKGKITKFANLYVLLIELNGHSILIARKDEFKGKNLIYFEEVSKKIEITNISFDDFNDENYIKLNDFLERLNSIMDIQVNPETIQFDFEKKVPKTNIRTTLPFIFQTQDIIDSKVKLFYEEPKPNHFPVLAGWFGPEYYQILKQIDKLTNSTKNLAKRRDDAAVQNKILITNLKNSLRQHYKLNGIEFDENWSIDYCLQRVRNLEQHTKVEYSNELQKRQDELNEIIEKHNVELLRINNDIRKIQNNSKQSDTYKLFIDKYNQRAKHYNINEEYKCPICGQENEQLTISAINLFKANEWLKNELTTVPVHTETFDKELNELKKIESELKAKLDIYKKEFIENKAILDKIKNLKNLNEEKQKAQWKVISDFEIYNSRFIKFDEKYFYEQTAQLEKLKERKNTYNENDAYNRAKQYIEEKMSLNVANLDFEHNPPNLYLDFHPHKDAQFKLYHINLDDETINLNRIGSASNALACHIGLFLSFLRYFANQSKSKVPTILFLDQPSQVYFPSGKDNTDIKKVSQIFETVLDEIQKIEEETGINPQVIIADHVKDLGEENVKLYEHYFKADFRNGHALVPNNFE